jgi:hypothetical protein
MSNDFGISLHHEHNKDLKSKGRDRNNIQAETEAP